MQLHLQLGNTVSISKSFEKENAIKKAFNFQIERKFSLKNCSVNLAYKN